MRSFFPRQPSPISESTIVFRRKFDWVESVSFTKVDVGVTVIAVSHAATY